MPSTTGCEPEYRHEEAADPSILGDRALARFRGRSLRPVSGSGGYGLVGARRRDREEPGVSDAERGEQLINMPSELMTAARLRYAAAGVLAVWVMWGCTGSGAVEAHLSTMQGMIQDHASTIGDGAGATVDSLQERLATAFAPVK